MLNKSFLFSSLKKIKTFSWKVSDDDTDWLHSTFEPLFFKFSIPFQKKKNVEKEDKKVEEEIFQLKIFKKYDRQVKCEIILNEYQKVFVLVKVKNRRFHPDKNRRLSIYAWVRKIVADPHSPKNHRQLTLLLYNG